MLLLLIQVSYWCIIKNGVGSTSSRTTKMTVILKPIASKPLTNLDLQEGKTATFSASIKGGKPLSYQWQKDSIDLDDQTKNKLSLRGVNQVMQALTSSLLTLLAHLEWRQIWQ